MKEQLIEFKTAILAKKKGLPQNIHYFSDYDSRPPYYGINNELCNGDEKRFGTCKAISQSLLQQWLRKEHKINIIVFPMLNDGIDCYYNYDIYTNLADTYSECLTYINTYEEALEKGLIEALKLIK